MKNLVDYINENSVNMEFAEIFENVLNDEREMTLQECYEELFDAMFSVNEGAINEGFFSKIGKAIASLGSKAATAGEELDKRVENASDAAKNAIDSAKKKAGDAWDKVKDTYQSVVVSVDDAIKASKDSIEGICKQTKLKVDEFESKCAQIYTNAIAKGKDSAKAVGEWVSDKTKGAQKFAAMNTMLAGAMLAKAAGIDSAMAIDILSAAGFN